MNAQQAKEQLFEKKTIVCSKEDYERDVRDGIIDYQMRQKDIGNAELENHASAELKRLDKEHGLESKAP